MLYEHLIRPLLFRFDPETAHEWSVKASRLLLDGNGLVEWLLRVNDPVRLGGVDFPNRVGLAAGFDKNARFIGSAQALGFGHLEVGAVTPLPQAGHPRPRLFRVKPGGLRNRMGFNNDGVERIVPRIPVGRRIAVGMNVGKGVDTPLERAAEDYLTVMDAAAERVDYFSVNISSPNTADLRELGRGKLLRELCARLVARRRRPLWLKVSPDGPAHELRELADAAAESGFDGLVATNTTLSRSGRWGGVDPVGGLSGSALRERSLEVVALLRSHLGAGFPLIGVGGVATPDDALAMRSAGADLVQIYTGFVYGGPLLPRRIARCLTGISHSATDR